MAKPSDDIQLTARFSIDELINEITWFADSRQISKVILNLDDAVCDADFTRKIIKKLKKRLK